VLKDFAGHPVNSPDVLTFIFLIVHHFPQDKQDISLPFSRFGQESNVSDMQKKMSKHPARTIVSPVCSLFATLTACSVLESIHIFSIVQLSFSIYFQIKNINFNGRWNWQMAIITGFPLKEIACQGR